MGGELPKKGLKVKMEMKVVVVEVRGEVSGHGRRRKKNEKKRRKKKLVLKISIHEI